MAWQMGWCAKKMILLKFNHSRLLEDDLKEIMIDVFIFIFYVGIVSFKLGGLSLKLKGIKDVVIN